MPRRSGTSDPVHAAQVVAVHVGFVAVPKCQQRARRIENNVIPNRVRARRDREELVLSRAPHEEILFDRAEAWACWGASPRDGPSAGRGALRGRHECNRSHLCADPLSFARHEHVAYGSEAWAVEAARERVHASSTLMRNQSGPLRTRARLRPFPDRPAIRLLFRFLAGHAAHHPRCTDLHRRRRGTGTRSRRARHSRHR